MSKFYASIYSGAKLLHVTTCAKAIETSCPKQVFRVSLTYSRTVAKVSKDTLFSSTQ